MRLVTGLQLGVLALLLLPAGCGYKAGGPFRTDIQSVYVDMADSRTFRRGMEFTLTEALKKRIVMDTPYKLAAREQADTILMTEVMEERQNAFAPDFLTQQPREKQVTLAVRVQWKDVRSGRLLADQFVQLDSANYLPPTGETEAYAQAKAIDRLAQDIVRKLYDDQWPTTDSARE